MTRARYTQLRKQIEQNDAELGTAANRLFYLSTPPSVFGLIIDQLEARRSRTEQQQDRLDAHHHRETVRHRSRFGARAASRSRQGLRRACSVYRIDHYLGKEPVQDIMALRFANVIFEPIWNRRYVDSVQITAAETVGVEDRGGYYDNAGALRDMIQNHVMNLLALVAMEPPVSPTADNIRDEKFKVLSALRPMDPNRIMHDRRAASTTPAASAASRYRLSRGAERQPAIEHRDLRGGEALHRQLALGRRAVLSAQRQTAGAQELRDRDPLQGAFRIAFSARPAIRSTATCS